MVESKAISYLREKLLVTYKDTVGSYEVCKYKVNFSDELFNIIHEALTFDRIGFTTTDTALNISLQADTYMTHVNSLTALVKSYDEVISGLSTAELSLCQSLLLKVQAQINRGCKVLNWTSLSIPEFLESCHAAITDFNSNLSRIRRSHEDIAEAVEFISNVDLFPIECRADLINLMKGKDAYFTDEAELPDVREFSDLIESNVSQSLEKALEKYNELRPRFEKVEELLFGKKTGNCKDMSFYYRYWEVRIFNALSFLTSKALHRFHSLLTSSDQGPLFKVTVSLAVPDIVMVPSWGDVHNATRKIVQNILNFGTEFVRWKDGSCHYCPPVESVNDEPHYYTFKEELLGVPLISKMNSRIQIATQKVWTSVHESLSTWDEYSILWKNSKPELIEEYTTTKFTIFAVTDVLQMFKDIQDSLDKPSFHTDIVFVRICFSNLRNDVFNLAASWIADFCSALHVKASAILTELSDEILEFTHKIDAKPETIDELKELLLVLSKVTERTMDAESEHFQCELLFTLLVENGFTSEEFEEQVAAASELGKRWEKLFEQAKQKNNDLEQIKVEFTESTKTEVTTFMKKVEDFYKAFTENGPSNTGNSLDDGLVLLKKSKQDLQEFEFQRDTLNTAENLFGLEISTYPELVKIRTEIDSLSTIFDFYLSVKEEIEQWSAIFWSELNLQLIEDDLEELARRLRKMKNLKSLPPYSAVEAILDNFQESIPLIQNLKSDALRPRHWEKLMEVTGQHFDAESKSFTLGSIFKMELHNYTESISEIVGHASRELQIETALRDIEVLWRHFQFEIASYAPREDSGEKSFILKGVDEITPHLEESLTTIQSMMSSKYVSYFVQEVQGWEKKLSHVSEVCAIWIQVQMKWMYLEGIFLGTEDIRNQLPEEAEKFEVIDKSWKRLMNEAERVKNVLSVCFLPNRLETLEQLYRELESCQKSLSNYLDVKRTAYPRFYFISDDELLSILGTDDPHNVQQHCIKLFDNTGALVFGQGAKSNFVVGMKSSEGETFKFISEIKAEGPVEEWMLKVDAEMRSTLHRLTKEAVYYYAKTPRVQWVLDNIGMNVLVGSQIWWTWEVEDVFDQVKSGNKHAMKQLLKHLIEQLHQLTEQVLENLTKNTRNKINTLIIIDVHARDVVDRFVRDSILDRREFDWESQLRFYWDKDSDDISIRQCTGAFEYGYEYMGLNGRLVITPLTDRCYMTLTQALSMYLGGSPAGPAGTGKTETVKDLAKAMALLCNVFNCGEGLDYQAMARIFSGLAECGAWGCFDEFNRIQPEVLSVVSEQIKTIQRALICKSDTLFLSEREIKLEPKIGIFITMNPGYAGRTELPDNLKALFRPVTMIVPDLEIICEISLFSQGFVEAKVLARKMTVLFDLAKGQLSKQHHYDFGLRSMKSILVMAGQLKADSVRAENPITESELLMRALRDMSLPKFVYEDVPLYLGLLNDLFPNLNVPRVRYPDFNDAVEQSLADEGYQQVDVQVDKVIQLYETMLTRHCTMVVGTTGGGKSVVISTLQKAQTRLGVNTKIYTINAKAVTVPELYGVLDPITRDWTNGLLSNAFRNANKPLPPEKVGKVKKYILFDGDVDAVWVENMNSVMDDNKVLTLANNERIYLASHCQLLFEVGNLSYASPATVSRCGMVYVDPKDLKYSPYFYRWVHQVPTETQLPILELLYEKYLPPVIEFVFEGICSDGSMKDPLALILPVTPP
ncbi:hypothetical protein GEMRC1_007950 [Eukaryota sp. GEM-RC1]